LIVLFEKLDHSNFDWMYMK